MADPVATNKPPIEAKTRNERRKYLKKLKRKHLRKEAAIKYREEEEARLNDPEEQLRIKLKEQEEAELTEWGRREFEERERLWIEAANKRKEEEEEKQKNILEDTEKPKAETPAKIEDDDEWDYVEDGPPEIIWQGNEIIIKKKKVKVAKKSIANEPQNKDVDRPTSNPLPPQPVAFASYNKRIIQEVLDDVGQDVPNFGTEQDKAHCPFHLKTGACRFGTRCNRVHFYPDKSCTLLIKNMYNGPGLAWEQDEGLEYTDEEVERSYEEFYEDVHTEFMKFGELINFKVCRNGSYHLRGNVYVHYKSLESAILAYNTMNGRFFAGKQLTCEFVGVTKWKIAICGEYMKSRLKTCSRGTACNFIHCFRNPGGDYEWADWDNPPPNYWARKMADFFGHSNQSSCEKSMELESVGSRRDSNRKRTPIYSRRHDSRNTTNEEVEDRDKIRDRHRSNKSDRSRRREETSFTDKHDSLDDNHRAKCRSYYEDEGMPEEKDGEIAEKHKRNEEKSSSYESHRRHKSNKRKDDEVGNFESHKRYKRSHRKDEISSTHKHEKSESKYRSSRHPNRNVRSHQGDGRNESSRCSSEDYHLFKNGNDLHDRYVGKYCSSDIDSDTDCDNTNKSGYNDGKHSSDEGDGCKTARDLQSKRSYIKPSRESCVKDDQEKRKHEVSNSSSDESLGRRAHKTSSRRRI